MMMIKTIIVIILSLLSPLLLYLQAIFSGKKNIKSKKKKIMIQIFCLMCNRTK